MKMSIIRGFPLEFAGPNHITPLIAEFEAITEIAELVKGEAREGVARFKGKYSSRLKIGVAP